MGCLYSSNSMDEDAGSCTMWDDTIEMNGCDDEGFCVCSDDPDPSYLCDTYESDYTCLECGCDLNVDECQCEDE